MDNPDCGYELNRLHQLTEILSESQRSLLKSCPTGQQLENHIDSLQRLSTHQRPYLQAKRFGRSLEHFLQALQDFCCTDPGHLSLVWGCLCVTVEVLHRFKNFFTTVATSFDRLSNEFDYFKHTVECVDIVASPDSVRTVLDEIYQELLKYLICVLGFMYRLDGERLQEARQLPVSFWRPFNFDHSLEKVNASRRYLFEEASISSGADAEGYVVLPEPYIKVLDSDEEGDVAYDIEDFPKQSLRTWLSPPAFADRYDRARKKKHAGTGEWIFEHGAYLSWYRSTIPNASRNPNTDRVSTLLVNGKPGSGKTILLGSIIEMLKIQATEVVVCYYLFDNLETSFNSSQDAYRALIFQLFEQLISDRQLQNFFSFDGSLRCKEQLPVATCEVGELWELSVAFACENPLVIILDGLDECLDAQAELMPMLKKLCKLYPLSLILSSRESHYSLVTELSESLVVKADEHNSEDIALYLKKELNFVNRSQLPEDFEINQGVTLSQRQRFAVFELDAPETLNTMCKRILDYIVYQAQFPASLASFVLGWLTYTYQDLTLGQMEDAVMSWRRGRYDEDRKDLEEFQKSIFIACGGFIECVAPSLGGASDAQQIHFVHSSVKEFLIITLVDPGLQSGRLQSLRALACSSQANIFLATYCIEYLIYSIPAEPISEGLGSRSCRENVRLAFPFSEYVVSHWAEHLLAAEVPPEKTSTMFWDGADDYRRLLSTLKIILFQPKALTAAIELSYIFNKPPKDEVLLEWAGCVQRSLPHRGLADIADVAAEIQKLAQYLSIVKRDWGHHLAEKPGCVWLEVGAFTPSPFIVKTPGINTKQLRSDVPLHAKLSRNPVNSTSRLLADGSHDMVVGVYPTRAFQECYAQSRLHSELFRDLRYSRGWIARVEVFSISSGRNVLSLDVALQASEVLLQLYQTLLQGQIQCPLAISPNGRCFSVCRTVYTLQYQGLSVKIRTSRLPLHSDPSMEPFWMVPDKDHSGFQIECYPRLNDRDVLARVYLYWIYFDSAGRDICVAEQIRSQPTKFKVFRLPQKLSSSSLTNKKPELITESQKWTRKFASAYDSLDAKDFDLAFHPFYHTIAIVCWSGTFIWNYDQELHTGTVKAYSGFSSVKRVDVSEDGNSCIVLTAGHQMSVSVDVTACLLLPAEQKDKEPGDRCPSHDHDFREGKDPTASRSLPLRQPATSVNPNQNRRIISMSSRALASGGQHLETIVSNANGIATMCIEKDGSSTRVDLARLPNWNDMAEAVPSAIAPSEPGAPIQIVLDRGLRTWNRVDVQSHEGSSDALPVVVERDPRSLRQSEAKSVLEALSSFERISYGHTRQLQEPVSTTQAATKET